MLGASRFAASFFRCVELLPRFSRVTFNSSRVLGYPKRRKRNEKEWNSLRCRCCFSSIAASSLFSPSFSSSSSSFLREFSLSLSRSLSFSLSNLAVKLPMFVFCSLYFFLGTVRPRMASVFPAYNHINLQRNSATIALYPLPILCHL